MTSRVYFGASALGRTPFTGPGGSYRLRVAAIDSLGRMGTADYDFTAELSPAGSVKLSDILLGVARESGFTPVLAFGNEVVATAYLELYGAKAGAKRGDTSGARY